ncbi:hypothetical protein BGX27_005835 [Mortierella sp. AM989]|nr:hypothetical protein BGX27_005835 [Mortierella sp. AM989]
MPSNRQQSPGTGPESTTPALARHQYSSVATQQQHPAQQRQPQQPQQQLSDQHDSTANGHQSANNETGGFFMKPLTRPPDYRFNLYVKGLAPTMTTRGLFDLFKPYGNILACKIILDTESGFCRGGFVLFDNQDSCIEARRGLTQQGLYVAVAHESASIKNLPPVEDPTPEIKPVIPEFDNSKDFPSLPSKPATKKAQNKKSQAASSGLPSLSTTHSKPASNLPDSNQSLASGIGAQIVEHTSPISTLNSAPGQALPHKSNEAAPSNNQDYGAFMFGQPFLDFDTGLIGNHQQLLSENTSGSNGFEWHPSVPDSKPYLGIDDIDRYMNMLELNAPLAIPQASGNHDGMRQPQLPNGAHISNTTIDDFMLEDRPRRESTLHFENLPEGLKYQELFELCAQYGSLVLTSVDIRYINEECFGQGRVTFESHKDSEAALLSLLEKSFDVRHGDSGDMYPSEPAIDDHLYDQYLQQHQDFLRSRDAAHYETSDELLTSLYQPGFFSTTPGAPFTPASGDSGEKEHFWTTPIPDQPYQFDPNTRGEHNTVLDVDVEILSNKHEKLSMLGISPQSISPSLASSSASSLQPSHEWTEPSLKSSRQTSSDQSFIQYSAALSSTSSDSEDSNDSTYLGSSKLLSYSDIVKVPAKAPTQTFQNKDEALQQDLKKRGNTNKSLDEKEYRLNLFLKNLEPTMNEFKLYEICVEFGPVMSCRTITTNHGVCTGLGFVMYINNHSVDLAIEGLKKLGYHAEVAVQSATNKLRCKTLSDMLFIQNIPLHVKENKVG